MTNVSNLKTKGIGRQEDNPVRKSLEMIEALKNKVDEAYEQALLIAKE